VSGRIITVGVGGAIAISGKCRVCGCTELHPCLAQIAPGQPLVACSWIDFDHTLCSNLRCIARIPLHELLEMPLLRDAA